MNKYAKYVGTAVIAIIIAVLVIDSNVKHKVIVKQEHRLIELEIQRNLLSDAIRNCNDIHSDNIAVNVAENYLANCNCDLDSLYSWSHCY